MRKFVKFTCIILMLVFALPMTAFATEVSTRRASEFFMEDSCYLQEISDNEFRVWFDVTGIGRMEEIGTSVITVQRSSDGSTWTDMKTYTKEAYSQMTAYNTVQHSDYVTYSSAIPGYRYRAYVKFYARNDKGTATLHRYTYEL